MGTFENIVIGVVFFLIILEIDKKHPEIRNKLKGWIYGKDE